MDISVTDVREATKKIEAWLKDVVTNPPKHQLAIVTGALLNGTNTVTNQHRFGYIGQGMTNLVAGIGAVENAITNLGGDLSDLGAGFSRFNSAAVREMNAVLDELKNPNIEGIPIHADNELETSTNDVAQKLYIRETSASKEYAMDNSVPKPKTWTIRGYLMSNPYGTPLESQLIIKPTLLAQRKLLQWFMDSRRPVWYKTHDNRFYKVLVTMFESQYTVQSLNSLSVNIQLTEFKALELKSEMSNVDIMSEVVA